MYRAKAWYLAGGVTAMDPVTLWATGGEPASPFAVAGSHYPSLLPRMTAALATLLGGWSETLVNLPYLLCALLLAGGSFALARDYGHGRGVSLVLAYLVLSTPLVGSHLSLGGQADIWMAASAGLGFAALCSGLIRGQGSRMILGLALVAVGTLFKVEGKVWLLGALLLAALGLRPRLTLGLLLGVSVLTGLMASLGLSRLELPALGTIGVSDGRLYVPFLGSYALQQYELADDYLANFFLGGSWNLLWYLVVGALAVALLRIRRRDGAVFVAFFAVATAAQVVIFFFTEQGAWADDWTAINRLPLHFVPALLFACLGLFFPPDDDGAAAIATPDGARTAARSAVATVVMALGLLAVTVATLALAPGIENGAGVFREGAALRPVMGQRSTSEGAATITAFDANVALLTTGPIAVQADTYSLVRIDARGSNRRDATLFWREAGSQELYSVRVGGLGLLYIDLAGEEGWQGLVTELGLVFYNDGGSVTVESLSLHAPSLAMRARKALADWRWVAPWSQRSVHWLPGGNPDAEPPLALTLLALLAVAGLIALVTSPRGLRSAALGGGALAAWMLFDASWLHQRTVLAARTVASYDLASSAPLAFGDDAISRAAVRRALCDRVDDWRHPTDAIPPRLLITDNSDADQRFQILRAKYHALPAPAHAHEGTLETVPVGLADRILVLKLRYGGQETRVLDSRAVVGILQRRSPEPLRLAWEDGNAFLIVRGDAALPGACASNAG
jgi:hypothetical protein